MRSSWAIALGGLAIVSCARPNPAFNDGSVATGGMTSGASVADTNQSTTGTTADSATAGGVSTDAAETSSGHTGSTGGPSACWVLPMRLLPPTFANQQAVLTDVPIMVDLSIFDRPADLEAVRFYVDDELLPHELEFDGVFAWVRIPRIESATELEFYAVLGLDCPARPSLPARDVWSHEYVAVWHFDDIAGGVFHDSANGIELQLSDTSSIGEVPWKLGRYLSKSSNQALTAVDERLDLHGPDNASVTSWVRLASGQEGVLPWSNDNDDARHRELVSKLPGYRLAAVRGQTSAVSNHASRPFFNIAATLQPPAHNVTLGPDELLADEWALVSGSYDASNGVVQCFLNDTTAGAEGASLIPGEDDSHDIAVGRFVHGGMDEVRIASAARSEDWVRVQYLSMQAGIVEYDEPEAY